MHNISISIFSTIYYNRFYHTLTTTAAFGIHTTEFKKKNHEKFNFQAKERESLKCNCLLKIWSREHTGEVWMGTFYIETKMAFKVSFHTFHQ